MAYSSGPQKKPAGELLKETREAKGISVQTVHEITKIPMDVLKAIEEGYTVHTLSPFYLKGFIKMYAQYLEVEIKHDDEPKNQTPPPEKEPVRVAPPRPKMEIPLDSSIFGKERQRQIVTAAGVLILLFLVFRMGGCIISKVKVPKTDPQVPPVSGAQVTGEVVPIPKPKTQKTPAGTPDQNAAVPQTQKAAAPEPAPVQKPKEAEPVKVVETKPQVEKIHLTIRARKKGWLQVKVDGALVLQSTIREGAVESWSADKQIEVSGRIIHELEFELNGKVLGALGRAERTARRVIVTKDGLSVKE